MLFNLNEINELINIAQEQKKIRDLLALKAATYHALGCIYSMIDKVKVFSDLKKICSTHITVKDLEVELCSFGKDCGSRRSQINKVYDWIYILKKTDLLERLANLLFLGHFVCDYELKQGTIHIIGKFLIRKKMVVTGIPCLPHVANNEKEEGMCTSCGSLEMVSNQIVNNL
jgi:hypothetical protein